MVWRIVMWGQARVAFEEKKGTGMGQTLCFAPLLTLRMLRVKGKQHCEGRGCIDMS